MLSSIYIHVPLNWVFSSANYERALEKLKLAEDTSDLQTDEEEPKRKRR